MVDIARVNVGAVPEQQRSDFNGAGEMKWSLAISAASVDETC